MHVHAVLNVSEHTNSERLQVWVLKIGDVMPAWRPVHTLSPLIKCQPQQGCWRLPPSCPSQALVFNMQVKPLLDKMQNVCNLCTISLNFSLPSSRLATQKIVEKERKNLVSGYCMDGYGVLGDFYWWCSNKWCIYIHYLYSWRNIF